LFVVFVVESFRKAMLFPFIRRFWIVRLVSLNLLLTIMFAGLVMLL